MEINTPIQFADGFLLSRPAPRCSQDSFFPPPCYPFLKVAIIFILVADEPDGLHPAALTSITTVTSGGEVGSERGSVTAAAV